MDKKLLILILFLSIGFANVKMIYPTQMDFKEDYVDFAQTIRYMKGTNLGDIAPGQTLQLTIDRSSISERALPGEDFLWNSLQISAPEVGWEKKNSELTPSLLTVYLTVPKDAMGVKSFYITAMNTEGQRGLRTPEKVPLEININEDVFEFLITEDQMYYAKAGRI